MISSHYWCFDFSAETEPELPAMKRWLQEQQLFANVVITELSVRIFLEPRQAQEFADHFEIGAGGYALDCFLDQKLQQAADKRMRELQAELEVTKAALAQSITDAARHLEDLRMVEEDAKAVVLELEEVWNATRVQQAEGDTVVSVVRELRAAYDWERNERQTDEAIVQYVGEQEGWAKELRPEDVKAESRWGPAADFVATRTARVPSPTEPET